MAQTNTEAAADTDRTTVYLGNHNIITVIDGEQVAVDGKGCTTVKLQPGQPLWEALQDIASPNGVWANHSADAAPAWVAAQGPLAEPLTHVLAAHYKCEIREPQPAVED
jgi:hypothetical protein